MTLDTMNFVPPKTLPLLPHQATVEIKGFLGQGATSLVYSLEKLDDGSQLIVKFMREASQEKDYRREAHILNTWRATFSQNSVMQERVPRLWAKDYQPDVTLFEGPATGYLIMTRVIGRQVTSLLEQHGPLEEGIVVRIGLQFAEVLDGLHTELQRTFTDLKLENIWWLANKEEICVTDWNVISEQGDVKGISDDLNRWARMLFQMLIGHDLKIEGKAKDAGFSKEELQQLGGQDWEDASFGIQEILTRALHPNPKQRYPSAKELADDLRLLDDARHNSIREIISLKVQDQVYGKGDELRHALWIADSATRRLDVDRTQHKRLFDLRDQAWERVQKQEQTNVAQFASHLRGGNFDAADRLAKGLIAENSEALRGHRLQKIAVIARNQENRIIDRLVGDGKEKVGGLLGSLEKGKFEDALRELESVKENASGYKQKSAWNDLKHDLTFGSAMTQAKMALQNNQLDMVLDFCDKAQKAWHDFTKFPTNNKHAQLLEEAHGQPTQLLNEAEKRKGAKTDDVLLNKVVATPNPSADALRQALRRLPDNRQLHQALFNAGVATLKNKGITEGLEYAKLVPLCISPDPSLLPFQRTTWALHHAEMALQDKLLPFEGVISHLQMARQSAKEHRNLEDAANSQIESLLVKTIKSAEPQMATESIMTGRAALLGMLKNAARDLNLKHSSNHEVKQALNSAQTQQAEVQQEALLSALSTTYSKAYPLLHSEQPKAIDSMRSVIQSLKKHMNRIQIQSLSETVTAEWKQLSDLDKDLTKLNEQLRQLNEIEQDIQALDKPASYSFASIQDKNRSQISAGSKSGKPTFHTIQGKLDKLAEQELFLQVVTRIEVLRKQLINKELDEIEAKIAALSGNFNQMAISNIQRSLKRLEDKTSSTEVRERIKALGQRLQKKVDREKYKSTIEQYKQRIKRRRSALGHFKNENADSPSPMTIKTELVNTAHALLLLDEENQEGKDVISDYGEEITGILPAQFMAVAAQYADKERSDKPAASDSSSSDGEGEQTTSQVPQKWEEGIQKILTTESLEDKKKQVQVLISWFNSQKSNEQDQADKHLQMQLQTLSGQMIKESPNGQNIARSSLDSALVLGHLAKETKREKEQAHSSSEVF